MSTVTLANFWHPVATSDEVLDQPRQFKLLGESLALYRDSEGIVAFKDLCIHRGTMLSLGTVADGRITCAYHGWQYDRDGACVMIPSLPEGSSIPRKARAITYPAAEAYGLVWVALEEPVAPIPPWPDNAYDDPTYHTFLVSHDIWNANAGRATENAMDLSHFNFVHTGLLALADGPVMKQHAIAEDGYRIDYSYNDGSTIRDYIVHLPFTVFIKKYGLGAGTSTEFDNKSAPEGGVMIYTQFHCPRDEKETTVFVHIGRNHTLDEDDWTFAGESVSEVLRQDRTIVESQRPEKIPTALREELHLKVPDASGISYRRLLGRIEEVDSFLP